MNQSSKYLLFFILLIFCFTSPAHAQRQKPDMEFTYVNVNPAFPPESGPMITMLSLNNSYVGRGAMDPFGKIAVSDGFRLTKRQNDIDTALASTNDILVIANPYLPSYREFPAMTPPSAFSDSQIEAIHDWVEAGGSLLILADHAPFGGGSSKLAARFGFEFLNGHAADAQSADIGHRRVNIEFTGENGLFQDHPVTNGETGRNQIDRFYAFGGQAFIPPPGAVQLMTIPDGWVAIFTYRLRSEIQTAMRIDASGMAQGAVLEYGKGRIAVFGEAGGFTAQVIDGELRFGFNTPEGRNNPELILSTLRWLAGYSP